jgi:glucose-1-phosphate thymidylyltransferase
MKVILLCAGYATRLYPLTQHQPKALLPVSGRPILEWILDKLREVEGVDTVYVVSNDRFAGAFQTWAERLKYPWPVRIVNDGTTTNENRLGAIGDLQFVYRSESIATEDVMVIAGDNLFTFDLKKFTDHSRSLRPEAVIAIYDVKNRELARQYGLVKINEQGKVLEFFEKPKDPPTTLASCGIYWLPSEARPLLDKYLSEGNNPDQPGHYMKWLAQQNRLHSSNLEGLWFDIGDLESYHKANEVFQHAKG